MDPVLRSTLVKVLLPLLGIGFVLFAAHRRRIDRRDGLGLQPPRPIPALLALTVWIGWMAATEWLIAQWQLEQASPWPDYPTHIVALRILAIGLLGPALEELIFRGVLYHILRQTRLKAAGAIVVLATAWGVMHSSYDPSTVAFIVLDGLLLGAARYTTASIWTPIAMHAMGNLYSIHLSLHG